RVRAQHPDLRVMVVGSGDGLEPLQRAVNESGHADAFVFTGWVPAEQVPAHLVALDVAVYPYRDTPVKRAKCSGKLHEYMAAGRAIVTNAVGQNLEYFEHMRSGYLARPGDVEDFA